jgi:hypothetical protein
MVLDENNLFYVSKSWYSRFQSLSEEWYNLKTMKNKNEIRKKNNIWSEEGFKEFESSKIHNDIEIFLIFPAVQCLIQSNDDSVPIPNRKEAITTKSTIRKREKSIN